MDGHRLACSGIVLLAALAWAVAAWLALPALVDEPPGWLVWHRVISVTLAACSAIYLYFAAPLHDGLDDAADPRRSRRR